MHLNDPKINRKYNYLYKITNTSNDKIYIGVHRTDRLDDGYMGSGVILKRAIKKYGKENFYKENLKFFPTYQEALDAEREVVTKEFIESKEVYNVKEGGYGNCEWSSEMIEILKESSKKRWEDPEYRKMMQEKCYDNEERNQKIGEASKEWIKNNPKAHAERMEKINKNPEKIRKMAETHRGMKRSDEGKKNISDAIKNLKKTNPEGAKRRCGAGMIYIHNPILNERKRIAKDDLIPEGWFKGMGKRLSK